MSKKDEERLRKQEEQRRAQQQAQSANSIGGGQAQPGGVAHDHQLSTDIDFAADAGKGLEGTDKDSFAIPFLAILQPMSPQVLAEEIEGIKAGLFLNSVTNQLFEDPLLIPCAFQRRWIRWAPRDGGGGFKGEFTPAEVNDLRVKGQVKELDGRLYFPMQDGSINEKRCDRLADTRSHFVLAVPSVDAELGIPMVFALTSTGIKVSKNWLTRIDGKKVRNSAQALVSAPSFAAVYRVTTEKKTNERGVWWQPVIDVVGDVKNAALYAQAKAFHAQVTAGAVVVAHESVRDTDTVAAGGSNDGF